MEQKYRKEWLNPDSQFANWLYEKYQSVWMDPEWQADKPDEWFDEEYKQFKKYHPSAGVFVKSLTTDEFMEWVNKLKNK